MKIREYYYINCELNLPFLETNIEHVKKIFKVLESHFALKKHSKQQLIDLGAGNGRIIIFTALNYGLKSVGIEIDKILVNEAKKVIKSLKQENKCSYKILKKIRIKQGDLYQVNLTKFDFIYIYSFPSMHEYLNHVFLSAKKDSIIISYKYPLDSLKSILKIELEISHKNMDGEIKTFFYRKI